MGNKKGENKTEEDVLSLDGAVKWNVNAETHQGMLQIQDILDNMDPLSIEDYNLMGNKCDEQTAYIITNCSMKGEAHNQLHYVLHPILDDIANLQKETTLEGADKAKSSLEKNLTDYFTYFEL